MDYDPRSLALPEVHGLLTRVVAPRPIALVSTLDEGGRGNLSPFSYFTLGGANPPSLVFCPVNDRHGDAKHTLLNVEATGEFVVNIVTFAMAERMNAASWTWPRGVDELDAVGFTRAPARHVRPPRVAESPIHVECRLFTVVRHGTGPLASSYVIGEIVSVHADESVLTNGLPDATKLDSIARLGEDWYARISPASLFRLARPEAPPR